MAKNDKSKTEKDPSIPQAFIPPSFSKRAPAQERPKIKLPEPKQLGGKDVLKRLSGLGKGWDAEIESLIAPPEVMYLFEGDASSLYSKERDQGIGEITQGLFGAKFSRPKSDYGIMLYETASTIYFVLCDMQRKILVRKAIFCFHDKPPEKDWSAVKDAIKAALSLSSGSDAKDTIAVHDGYSRLVRLE